MVDRLAYVEKPFRVIHEQSDTVVQGFDDMSSAEEDATDRNQRAKTLGVVAKYKAVKKD